MRFHPDEDKEDKGSKDKPTKRGGKNEKTPGYAAVKRD